MFIRNSTRGNGSEMVKRHKMWLCFTNSKLVNSFFKKVKVDIFSQKVKLFLCAGLSDLSCLSMQLTLKVPITTAADEKF